MKPSKPQAMPAINMAGWPFKMAGQRVQPSHTDTATMASPSTSQMRASTVRLSAPGCRIGRVYGQMSIRLGSSTPGAPLVDDVGHRGVVRAHGSSIATKAL